MRTSRPISTISYNSEKYLVSVLQELHRNHVIADWWYIKHFAEKDENKDHIHLYINPNRLIDTMSLQDKLIELDYSNLNKPLGCIPFRYSKADDWILYCLHLESYLIYKGEEREYHYLKDDFKVCDPDSFDDAYNHALKGSDFARKKQILESLKYAVNPVDLINNGMIPLSLATNVKAYKEMNRHRLKDDGFEGSSRLSDDNNPFLDNFEP